MKFGQKYGIGFITRFDTDGIIRLRWRRRSRISTPLFIWKRKKSGKPIFIPSTPWLPLSQAVEDSGIIGTVEPERLGVYVGSGIGGMTHLCHENCKKLFDQRPEKGISVFYPFYDRQYRRRHHCH